MEPQKPKREYEFAKFDIDISDPRIRIIDEILGYAERHKSFDTEFVDGVQEYLDRFNMITARQYNGLVSVYYSYHMHREKAKAQHDSQAQVQSQSYDFRWD